MTSNLQFLITVGHGVFGITMWRGAVLPVAQHIIGPRSAHLVRRVSIAHTAEAP